MLGYTHVRMYMSAGISASWAATRDSVCTMKAAGPFGLRGDDVLDIPSQEQQALKKEKALRHLRVYVERCGGTLPQSWDCAIRFRTTTRRHGRLGLTTDNYYYSPCGKTFRTHRQVADFLGLPEPQQQQPQHTVRMPGQLSSSTLAAHVPTDPRIRAGLKRTSAAVSAEGSCKQSAKRPVSPASSCCTAVGVAASDITQAGHQALVSAVAAPVVTAATSFSMPSSCSEQQPQQPGSLEQSAQSMPPPPAQLARRTKGLLAAKYAGISAGTGAVRSNVAINSAGSFYDLCFALVAAGSSQGSAQQHPIVVPMQTSAVSMPIVPPDDEQKQQVVAQTAALPAVAVAQQQSTMVSITAASTPQAAGQEQLAKPAPEAVPAAAGNLQELHVVSATSSSTSSSNCTADSDQKAVVVDSRVESAPQQPDKQQLLPPTSIPAKPAAPISSACVGFHSGQETTVQTAVCATLISGTSVGSSLSMQSSIELAPAVAKPRKRKEKVHSKNMMTQQQQRQSPVCKDTAAIRQQQPGPKPWKPRAQPAWRAQLRQLASQIAAEKAAANSSAANSGLAAAASSACGATVQ